MQDESPAHPMQPLYKDKDGVYRFRANGIIRKLLDDKLIDLNEIGGWAARFPGITSKDVDQFWQLLGYSVGGYCELAGGELISEAAADAAEAALKAAEKNNP